MEFSAERLAQLNDNPLYRVIGIQVHEVRDGFVRSTLTPEPEVCWPSPAQPHGGILFTVIDTSMAFAAISIAQEDTGCATVDCSIQYPAPARHGPFTCVARTHPTKGRTVFVRAEITDAQGAVVAFGQATFRLLARKS